MEINGIELIEAPCNTFPSQITGHSGEQVYWAPVGSLYPVCPDGIEKQKVNELFDKATLAWADFVCPANIDVLYEAPKSEKGLEMLKQTAFNEGIPFVSISSMPLNETYFEDHYAICYFASEPYKIAEKTYLTVGVIGP